MNRLEDNKDIGGHEGNVKGCYVSLEKMLVLIREKNLTFYFGVIGDAKNIKGQQDIKQCQGHVGEHLTTLGKCQRCRVTLRKHHRTQDLFFQSTRKR